MASLTSQSIASSYEQLLHVDRDGGGNGTTLVDVKDGDNGSTFAIKLATDKVRIEKLGIGEDSPDELLHLKSTSASKPTIKIENSGDVTNGSQIHFVNSTTDENDDDISGTIRFKGMNDQNAETEYATLYVKHTDITDNEEDSQIHFRTMAQGTLDSHLVISSNNLGVGTSAPSNRVHVVASSDPLYVTDGASAFTGVAGRMIQLKRNATNGNDTSSFCSMVMGNNSNGFTFGYGGTTDRFRFKDGGGNEVLSMKNGGEINKDFQPSFQVTNSSDHNNIAVGTSWIDKTWDTEIFDVGSNFASNTFTAPVTGKYLLTINLGIQEADSTSGSPRVSLQGYIVTSNRNYLVIGGTGLDEDSTIHLTLTVVADMDASDTAKVQYRQINGSAQADVVTSSFFAGYLLG